jgi:hypothetical protein
MGPGNLQVATEPAAPVPAMHTPLILRRTSVRRMCLWDEGKMFNMFQTRVMFQAVMLSTHSLGGVSTGCSLCTHAAMSACKRCMHSVASWLTSAAFRGPFRGPYIGGPVGTGPMGKGCAAAVRGPPSPGLTQPSDQASIRALLCSPAQWHGIAQRLQW